jgi:imidazoleglycerol-phosphate dehydratase
MLKNMEKRSAEIHRTTRETDILLRLRLDGEGEARLDYPLGFMSHMLTALCRYSLFDLEIKASGDLETGEHHLIEDTGLVLGEALRQALGEKRGIRRYASCLLPMDEALARAVLDFSGRPFLVYTGPESVYQEFFYGLCAKGEMTLHLDILRGRSEHHQTEALFKALGIALREAVEIDPRKPLDIPSTQGLL